MGLKGKVGANHQPHQNHQEPAKPHGIQRKWPGVPSGNCTKSDGNHKETIRSSTGKLLWT